LLCIVQTLTCGAASVSRGAQAATVALQSQDQTDWHDLKLCPDSSANMVQSLPIALKWPWPRNIQSRCLPCPVIGTLLHTTSSRGWCCCPKRACHQHSSSSVGSAYCSRFRTGKLCPCELDKLNAHAMRKRTQSQTSKLYVCAHGSAPEPCAWSHCQKQQAREHHCHQSPQGQAPRPPAPQYAR
jgi:hypothetical protein